MKILNLYAGIGGNRKLWDKEHQVVAVELDPAIAEIYKSLYPEDDVIVGDAHSYLQEHFNEFDFIWSSPPCQTHSSFRQNICVRYRGTKAVYPDMKLYQEIILLQNFYKGKWVIENVKPYYEPLIQPTFSIDRHYFWSSDFILTPQFNNNYTSIRDDVNAMAKQYDIDINILKSCNVECRLVLRNMVVPEIGKYIFDRVIRERQ